MLSHTVGSEHTYYRWLKTLMKKSPSHAVGLEQEMRKKGIILDGLPSPSHMVGWEQREEQGFGFVFTVIIPHGGLRIKKPKSLL